MEYILSGDVKERELLLMRIPTDFPKNEVLD